MNPLGSQSDTHFWPSAEFALVLALVFLFLAFWKPALANDIFQKAEQSLSRFAKRKTLAVFLMFVGVVSARLAALPLLPVPIPGIHDEFSYLLMADTFAHGRLANPTHPMWMSFETFHVNWFPTYSSMYPPAQGFVMAIGQLLGNPWIGVLLSDAAMCAAILWMLQAWMPTRWALLGGVFAALNLGIASYWMNSYWGGAVAGIGGALVLGALARIARRLSVSNALLLGLGVAILANSRPYEGFLFCVPAGLRLFWWLIGKTKSHTTAGARIRIVLLPLSAILVFTVAFIGYYNWRLTGNALLMPHVLNTRTYHSTPLFLWEHLKPELTYHNQQFEDFYNGWEREDYQTTWKDARDVTAEKLARMGVEFFWPGVLFLLPAIPFAFRDRKMRLLLVTLFLCLAGVFAVIWSAPHYAAPATCVIYALLAQAVRHLRTMEWKGRQVGVALSRALVVLLLLSTGVSIARRSCDPLWWTCTGDPSRVAVIKQLMDTPGKHLIVVRYSDDHNIHDEWVYNGADIDGSKIIWARELDPEQNAKLFSYFQDRHIWLVEPDVDNTDLKPYTPPPDQ
jgi:type II secretory pathway component PulM